MVLNRSCIPHSSGPVCLESALILLVLLIQAPVSAFLLMLVSSAHSIWRCGAVSHVEVAGWMDEPLTYPCAELLGSSYLGSEEKVRKCEPWAHTIGEFLIMEPVQRVNRLELKSWRTHRTGREPSCHLHQRFLTGGQSTAVDAEWVADEPCSWPPHRSGQLSRVWDGWCSGASCCKSI